jgi:hypothetical protein
LDPLLNQEEISQACLKAWLEANKPDDTDYEPGVPRRPIVGNHAPVNERGVHIPCDEAFDPILAGFTPPKKVK